MNSGITNYQNSLIEQLILNYYNENKCSLGNVDLSIFDTYAANDSDNNKINIQVDDLVKINNTIENDLNLNNSSNTNYMNNTQNAPNLNNIDDIASLGVNLMGTFIGSADSIVKGFNEAVKEFQIKVNEVETKINTNKNSNANPKPYSNNNNSDEKIFRHEDDNCYYYVIELPRVRKEDCKISYKNESHILSINAKTEECEQGFKFLEDKLYELKIEIPKEISIEGNNISAKYRNGVLYIFIKKMLINLDNNININILD